MSTAPSDLANTKIAINGYGRIGRCVARALLEGDYPLSLVAINEPADVPNADIARLTQYDSVQGRFGQAVTATENGVQIGQQSVLRLQETNLENISWSALGVDLVLDCSGLADADQGRAHLQAGAKRVLFSRPTAAAEFTVVYGYNHRQLPASAALVSNASCTTNCLTLLLQPLQQALHIEQASITTVHAWTADQNLVDGWHRIPRRERAAPHAIVPTSSGAADGVMAVMPELQGKLTAHSLRVPVSSMSLAEVTLLTDKTTDTEGLRQLLTEASSQQPELIGMSAEPLVSCDFIHDPRSAIIDEEMTQASGRLLKVLAWHDNEWAYACRMLDTAGLMASQL
jgi:glyceraldehyde-3-phosphate dehydrogenase type I